MSIKKNGIYNLWKKSAAFILTAAMICQTVPVTAVYADESGDADPDISITAKGPSSVVVQEKGIAGDSDDLFTVGEEQAIEAEIARDFAQTVYVELKATPHSCKILKKVV